MALAVRNYEIAEQSPAFPESTAPLAASEKKRLTLEQAERLAAGQPFELIDGRMEFKMADNHHADTQILLGAELVNYFKENRVGIARTEFTLRLWPENPYEGRVPDLSIILNENLNMDERYFARAPDIAVEIISSDDAWKALFEKAQLYFEHGSREVWLVDPYQKGVMIVTPKARRWEWEELTSPELLPGFCVKMKDIFTWPIAQTEPQTK